MNVLFWGISAYSSKGYKGGKRGLQRVNSDKSEIVPLMAPAPDLCDYTVHTPPVSVSIDLLTDED